MPDGDDERTPNGGVRSAEFLYDADGRETPDPAAAVRGVIAEYDADGVVVARTHFETKNK
jgi:hypothetical protein